MWMRTCKGKGTGTMERGCGGHNGRGASQPLGGGAPSLGVVRIPPQGQPRPRERRCIQPTIVLAAMSSQRGEE